MRCIVSCSSTSFPWLVFFFGALLWGSMIHKHTGRWMCQGSAPVVSWNWEKYSCYSKLVSTFLMLLSSVLSWRVSQAWNPHHTWAQVLEACDSLMTVASFCPFTLICVLMPRCLSSAWSDWRCVHCLCVFTAGCSWALSDRRGHSLQVLWYFKSSKEYCVFKSVFHTQLSATAGAFATSIVVL